MASQAPMPQHHPLDTVAVSPIHMRIPNRRTWRLDIEKVKRDKSEVRSISFGMAKIIGIVADQKC
jgi:hypothetical protein